MTYFSEGFSDGAIPNRPNFFARLRKILSVEQMKTRREFRNRLERRAVAVWFELAGQAAAAKNRTQDRACEFANASKSFASEQARQEARLAHHGRAVVGISEEHALLRGEALSQDSHVAQSLLPWRVIQACE